jgi:hypothetical protein
VIKTIRGDLDRTSFSILASATAVVSPGTPALMIGFEIIRDIKKRSHKAKITSRRKIMTITKVNQVNLNYEESGKGETIVFLHGFTGSHQDWKSQIEAIKNDYRCLALAFVTFWVYLISNAPY